MHKHGYSKRHIWHKVQLARDANTGQLCEALTANQDAGDTSVLFDRLGQIGADMPVEIVGDRAHHTKQAHAVIADYQTLFSL